MFDVIGREIVVWEGTDPLADTRAAGIAKIPVAKSFVTQRIKIYLDSPAVPGWNEIDAVGLVSSSGKKYWASDVKASSEYGSQLFAPNLANPVPVLTQFNFTR